MLRLKKGQRKGGKHESGKSIGLGISRTKFKDCSDIVYKYVSWCKLFNVSWPKFPVLKEKKMLSLIISPEILFILTCEYYYRPYDNLEK